MNKARRHRLIRDLVARGAVATQQGLADLLRRRGVDVNQATLSRDIREIGLVKVPHGNGDGRPRYVEPRSVAEPPRMPSRAGRLVRAVEPAGRVVLVKTDPGLAAPVALSLDRLGWPEVAGTVAGDDTLLVIVRDGHSPRRVARRLQSEVFA